MVAAEISIFPIGTSSSSVSDHVAAAVRELEGSGLSCTPGPMGTTVEGETLEQVFAAAARAQQAVFQQGAGRVYAVLKIDERRDVEDRSTEDMMRSVRESQDDG